MPNQSKSSVICLLVSSVVNGISQVSHFHFLCFTLLSKVKDKAMLNELFPLGIWSHLLKKYLMENVIFLCSDSFYFLTL